jgi:L-fuculose-phosphate aldolase
METKKDNLQMDELKKLLAFTMRRMYQHNYIVAGEGNVSARFEAETILITPGGLDKGTLTPEDIVCVDLNGKVLSGNHQPSSEINMHIAAYQARPDVNAVVHGHPPYATGFATAHIEIPSNVLPEAAALLGKIPVVQYGQPSCAVLAEKVKPYLPSYNCFLLENHGALTLGKNMQEAFHRFEILENTAKVTIFARLLGGEKLLPQNEIDKLLGH